MKFDLSNIKSQITKLINKIKNLPRQQQLAYAAIILGIILILISILVWP